MLGADPLAIAAAVAALPPAAAVVEDAAALRPPSGNEAPASLVPGAGVTADHGDCDEEGLVVIDQGRESLSDVAAAPAVAKAPPLLLPVAAVEDVPLDEEDEEGSREGSSSSSDNTDALSSWGRPSVEGEQEEEEEEEEWELVDGREQQIDEACFLWIYQDSWGNELVYPPTVQTLLEREWRAGRERALLPGTPYTVLFSSHTPEQHAQLNRGTGTRRRVLRLARLPKAPRGVGGWALLLKAKARVGVEAVASVRDLGGPGAVLSRAAVAGVEGVGRALVRRAPSRGEVAQGALVAARRTVSLLQGILRRVSLELERWVLGAEEEEDEEEEEQGVQSTSGRHRRREGVEGGWKEA